MKKTYTKKILIVALIALLFIMIFNIKVYAEETETTEQTETTEGTEETPLSLSEESLEIALNGTKYLYCSGGVIGESVTWESSDTSVATVEDGTVSALKIGTTTITATKGNETASCEVNVVYSYITIGGNNGDSISNVNLILKEHETEQLYTTVKDYDFADVADAQVEWSSNDSSIVTVEKDTGLITAQKAGKATITAKAAGVTDTVEVNVFNAPEFTDFSNATYKSELDYDIETLQISGIEPNDSDGYYYVITPNESKPNIIFSTTGGVDTEKMEETIEHFLINEEEKYMYTRELAKYTELNQDLYLWIIQEVRLEDSYVDEEGNYIYRTSKFVVEGEKLTRAELPPLNLILQTFDIGHWSSTETEENDNYTYMRFNFPTQQENRKFTLKIGKVTDINILSKIQKNDYSGITELLSYAKTHDAVYSQTLTTTSEAYYRSDESLFDGYTLLQDDAYYYIYVEFDDENGKYYPIEGVTLGQAWKSSNNSNWDLWAYTADNFDWDNLIPSYTPSEPTPSEPTPEKDTTTAPSILPNAGSKTVIAILVMIMAVSIILYKKYNKFNDIK